MDFYDEIKNELINNEIYRRVKNYSKNRSDLQTYYNILSGLYNMRLFYNRYKNFQPLAGNLS